MRPGVLADSIILVCLACCVPLRAQSFDELRELEQKWFNASGIADADTIADIMDDSFYGINFDGTTWDKASWVRSVRDIQHDATRLPGWRKALSEYATVDEKIRILGDTAVVTGWRKRDGSGHRFMHVWLRREGQWRLANTQTTSLSPARCAGMP
jgi:hypothetical protein